jgi:hypothetical protein
MVRFNVAQFEVLKIDKNHDTIVVKTKLGKDYHGMSTGNMSALRKRPCKEKRNIQEWETTIFVLS